MDAIKTAYIGLGANLGNPQDTVLAAMGAIEKLGSTRMSRRSSLYLTVPIDADGSDYVNAAVKIQTRLSPHALLLELQQIERHFGRVRPYQNAPRTLDCDLLLYEQQIINTPTLSVPHPRMHQRAFVLIPLLEITPDITIPSFGPAYLLLGSVGDQSIQKLVAPS